MSHIYGEDRSSIQLPPTIQKYMIKLRRNLTLVKLRITDSHCR